jgi:aminopeptidase N
MNHARAHVVSGSFLLTALTACSAMSTQVGGVRVPPEIAHTPRTADFDVEHYALDLALDPAARSIQGTCRVRLWSRAAHLARIELDLERLVVKSVHDERGRKLAFKQHDGKLSIELADSLARDASLELSIEYGGKPAKGLWFTDDHDGVATQVFTQGECEDARWWFPCFDEPSDRATSEVRVELPPHWTATAAGERVDHGPLDGDRTFEVWRMSTPHPTYLTTLVAGDFATDVGNWDGLPLVALADPRYAPVLRAAFEETGQVLGFLSDLTGVRYPYPKYSQACVENFPFGGMENISATTLTDTMLRDERGMRDGDPHGLIAHEAAHQWFGNLLTCSDWSHIWLNESFATYCTLLYEEATRGTDSFRIGMRDTRDGYLAQDVGDNRRPMVWSTYREPMDLFFGGQTYPGGATRLHYLRFVLGDDAFFSGLKRYVADNRGRGVTTHDFESSMSASSGVDLRGFFAQWFEQPGYPEFQVSWKYDDTKHVARLSVEQVQLQLHDTPGVFRCSADVEVRDASGARKQRVEITERQQTFEFPAESKPIWVVFDKYGWLPARIANTRSNEEWLALLADDDDVNGRRDAARAVGELLARPGSDDERWTFATALMDALAADKCAAVRAAAAQAFGGIHVPADNPIAVALMHAAANDADVGVRLSAFGALGRFGASPEIAKFAREQFDAGFSWGTMGGAATLAVVAEPESALAWLSPKLAMPSPHDSLRASLLGTLNLIAGNEVTAELRRRALDESADPASRDVAVRLLARRAKQLAEVRRELTAMLATATDYRLQSGLIDALAEFGDPAARAALSSYYTTCVDQRQKRAIEKALRDAAGA